MANSSKRRTYVAVEVKPSLKWKLVRMARERGLTLSQLVRKPLTELVLTGPSTPVNSAAIPE